MIELILIFCIVAAIIALESKNLLSSIISLGGVGFGLAIIMLFLRAPDVAIVQILVEVILLVILIRATINRDVTVIKCKKEFFTKMVGVSILAALLIVFIFGIASLPEFASSFVEIGSLEVPAHTYLSEGLADTGSPNIVTAIILDYRVYDTLGEVTVLFTAIIGALAIIRKKKNEQK